MGLLDRAKKLAEQAKEAAELVKGKAEEALAEAKSRTEAARGGEDQPAGTPASAPAGPVDERMGTPYRPGMLGKPGWREQGLDDPAAVLPIADRDRAGIPHSTKSEIVEEPFGVGRRWTSGDRSAGLFYRLDDDHRSWQAPGGTAPLPGVPGAVHATLDDGRTLVFLQSGGPPVVVELQGLGDAERAALAGAAADQLG